MPQLDGPLRGLAPSGERLDQGRLAGAVGPDEDQVLAPLDPQRRILDQHPPRDLDPRALHLQREATAALRLGEAERQSARLPWIGRDRTRLELLDLLDPRLRLPGLRRLVAEPFHEPLHPGDLRLLLLDRAPERDLAGGLLAPPGVPGTREEAGPARLQLEHRCPDGLEKPAVVGDQDYGRIELLQVPLQPLQRRDVEVVGRLVEQQQIGARRQRPGERGAGQLSTREGRERPRRRLGIGLEAETAQHGEHVVAPAVSAGRLELLLGPCVGLHRRLVVIAGRHRSLEPLELALELEHLRAGLEHVVAQ